MYTIDFSKPVSLYFIGIGGISMSGLAEILHKEGFTISGSDRSSSLLTEKLRAEDCTIFYTQAYGNLKSVMPDIVVYSAAIHRNHPEYMEAVDLGLPLLTRAELLGQLMANYETSIAVSGTHGKTTTTAMISEILIHADKDPTISIGGILPAIHGNVRLGKGEVFVTEACEYTNSFLSLAPKYEIILNIEEDHLDFFDSLEDIRNSFRRFAKRCREDGILFISGSIEDHDSITKDTKAKVVTFGREGHGYDYEAGEPRYEEHGMVFPVRKKKEDGTYALLGNLKLLLPGKHNIENSLAALAVSMEEGISFAEIRKTLGRFHGAERRFQKKGIRRDVTVIDDYAHHPSEIRATLKMARHIPSYRIVTVFQPHTYSRTKSFFDDFADALSLSDLVILPDIYAARETDTLGVSSEQLAKAIRKRGTEAYYIPNFPEILDFLEKTLVHGDLLITMGAGDVFSVGEQYLKR